MKKFTKKIALGLLVTLTYSQTKAQVLNNNLCSEATPLTVSTTFTPISGTVVGAIANTSDLGQPSCWQQLSTGDSYSSADVWYSFVANSTSVIVTMPNEGISSINPEASFLIFGVEAYDAPCTAMASSSNIGCVSSYKFSPPYSAFNSDAILVLSNLVEGNTYYLRVFEDEASNGNFVQIENDRSMNFTIGITSPPPPPVNDKCSGAIPLTVNTTYTPTLGTNNGTIPDDTDPSDPNCLFASNPYYSSDVWYNFVATASDATIFVPSTSVSSNSGGYYLYYGVEVFSGSDCAALSYDTCVLSYTFPGSTVSAPLDNGLNLSGLTVGQTYYIRFYESVATSALGDPIPNDRSLNFSIGLTSTMPTPLAINLKSITAKNVGNANIINWEMASENEIDRFEIERSNDGKIFNYADKINGHTQTPKYIYTDNSPIAGANYYRLKMVDKKGDINYSKTVIATVTSTGNAGIIQVYPNPTGSDVKVKVLNTQSGVLKLTDITGKVLLQKSVTSNEMDIPMSQLPSGIYFIQCVNNNATQVVKITKQ